MREDMRMKDDQSLNEELTEELRGLIEAYNELKRV